jgi:CDP-diacylglycerol--serine O-phosphatidyltransferase
MKLKSQIPNLFTLLNLLSGCIAAMYIIKNDFITAFLFVIIGITFDFFDGFLARLLKVESPLGVQLDSLADMVTSGFVPGLAMVYLLKNSMISLEYQLEYFMYFSWFGFLITLASCYRLAVFNISTNQSSSFVGLPTPSSALVVLSIGMIYQLNEIELLTELFSNTIFLFLVTLFLAYLMNSKVNLFALKFKNFSFVENKLQYIFLLIVLILLILLQRNAVPFIIFIYIVLSILFFRVNEKKPL